MRALILYVIFSRAVFKMSDQVYTHPYLVQAVRVAIGVAVRQFNQRYPLRTSE